MTHRDSTILPSSRSDIRDINLVHPSLKRRRTCHKDDESRYLSRSGRESGTETTTTPTPHFDPEEGYTMATHVVKLPDGSAVYQTTNPMVPIWEESVLGTARLER